ncbi:MAG: glycosyltransferase family A protein [Thermosphaera sp.]
MKVCIYGTVYNNAVYVEQSIKSVWRPDAEIVIVDSFSTDGTWEKLVELKKDFNLKLYRYKCSRGLGRHIALTKCSEGSITSYFDLDTIYNINFHRAIDAAETHESIKYNGGLVIRREEAIKKGGWRDLNYTEDTEFTVRMNPKVFVPVEAGENACPNLHGVFREKRYEVGLDYVKRLLKAHRDYVMGTGFNCYDILYYRSKRLMILSPLLVPWIMKSYRLLRVMDNLSLENALTLFKMRDPKELGMDDNFFFLNINYKLLKMIEGGERTVDSIVRKKFRGQLYKIKTSSRHFALMYVKNALVLRYNPFVLPIIRRVEIF